MEFIIADFQSPEYQKILELRFAILRKPLGLEFDIEQLKKENSDFHLGLFEDGNCLACCVLSSLGLEKIKLRQMAVQSHFQSSGFGKILLEKAESFAKGKGFKKMILHAREHAIGFYKKSGYSEKGDLFEEVGIPHRLMEKILSS
jgi:predicted GNAT family N-acyltransferase